MVSIENYGLGNVELNIVLLVWVLIEIMGFLFVDFDCYCSSLGWSKKCVIEVVVCNEG